LPVEAAEDSPGGCGGGHVRGLSPVLGLAKGLEIVAHPGVDHRRAGCGPRQPRVDASGNISEHFRGRLEQPVEFGEKAHVKSRPCRKKRAAGGWCAEVWRGW